MANEGIKFQEDFVASIVNKDISWDRLKDPVGGRRGVANICDYILYLYPNLFYLELKCYRENTINFKAISDTQYDGLLAKYGKTGILPGVLLSFQDHSEVWFMHIDQVRQLKAIEGKKSIHIKDCREMGVRLEGERKRTRFRYNVEKFLKEVATRYEFQ